MTAMKNVPTPIISIALIVLSVVPTLSGAVGHPGGGSRTIIRSGPEKSGVPDEALENPAAILWDLEAPAQNTQVDPEFRYKVGLAALDAGDLSTALQEFEAAARLSPDNALIRYNLAIVYQKRGAFAAALENLERAVTLGLPDHLQKLAADLLPKLTYQKMAMERGLADQENTAQTNLTWISQRTEDLSTSMCVSGETWVNSERFEFQGQSCDMSLIRTSKLESRGGSRVRDRSATPYRRTVYQVLSRLRNISALTVRNENCSGSASLIMGAVTLTVAPAVRGPEETETLYFRTPEASIEMRRALENAKTYCSVRR